MRRDKDCPYKSSCHDVPECCPECDWHLTFEKFRNRIARLENRLSRTKAELDMYRGIEGCRYREMTDAEHRGRCLTLPEHSSDSLAAFRQFFKEFAFTLCMEGPDQEVLDICLSISEFLEKAEMAAVMQEVGKPANMIENAETAIKDTLLQDPVIRDGMPFYLVAGSALETSLEALKREKEEHEHEN